MKHALAKFSARLPRREVQVKAHAYAMASVVMLFFFPFAVFGVIAGFLDRKLGPFFLGSVTLLFHALLITLAFYHWRTEKEKLVICFDPDGAGAE